jgi:hypothetical protein
VQGNRGAVSGLLSGAGIDRIGIPGARGKSRHLHDAVRHVKIGAHALKMDNGERAIKHFRAALEKGRDRPGIARAVTRLASESSHPDVMEAVRDDPENQ